MKKPLSNSAFLRKGFQILRKDFPERFTAASYLLEKIPGVYILGDEQFAVTAKDGLVSVRKRNNIKTPRVRATFSPVGIIAVVDGTETVQNLLSKEELIVFADADALIILSEVLRFIMELAIWSSALQNHFEDYRKWVSGLAVESSE
jgi:hypothetical protein